MGSEPKAAQRLYLGNVFVGISRKYVSKNYLPSANESKLPSHQVFGVFALEVNKILQATPSNWEWKWGRARLQHTYSSSSSIIRCEYSLYVLQSRASRSRCSIPGTWYRTCKHPTDYTLIRGMGVCLARKNSL